MKTDTPTYLPGDVVIFELELEHNIPLGDAWATFFFREEREGAKPFPLQLNATEIRDVGRAGDTLISAITFEVTLSKTSVLAGIYHLDSILGLPEGERRDGARRGMILDTPSEVSFRISGIPSEPVSKATSWGFGYRLESRRPPTQPRRRYGGGMPQ